MKDFLFYIALGAALVIGFAVFRNTSVRPYDDTDPPGGRSGMAIRTDHLTGCMYLVDGRGGLTPRMTVDGKHMGCRS